MTIQQLQESRLARMRLERDTKGCEIIAHTNNSPATVITLMAIDQRSPGWERRFIELRGKLGMVEAGILDDYKSLCERVRESQKKYNQRYGLKPQPQMSHQ